MVTYQAEDEIAGIGSAIGASFGGALGGHHHLRPGPRAQVGDAGPRRHRPSCPLVIINVQRGGPSTGMPTKTEQSDLYIALFGRHGEAPMPVIAAPQPGRLLRAAMEAIRVAVKWMTPVLLLTDGYLGFGSEPFRIPDEGELPSPSRSKYQTTVNDPAGYMPYKRDEKLIRPWAIPGTPGLEHRIGGLEKDSMSGMVSYDGMNHERMVKTRAQKVRNIIEDVPDVEVDGEPNGDLLLVSWGGTYGSVRGAADPAARRRARRWATSTCAGSTRCPKNLGAVLKSFKKVHGARGQRRAARHLPPHVLPRPRSAPVQPDQRQGHQDQRAHRQGERDPGLAPERKAIT